MTSRSVSCFDTRLSLVSVVVLLVVVLVTVDATITVPSKGTKYQSYPDRWIGLRFREGLTYDARLQRIPNNINLCANEHPSTPDDIVTFNITRPLDPRMPVALLASGRGCEAIVKARLASYDINPPDLVKFLIIYNDDEEQGSFSSGSQEESTVKVLDPSFDQPPSIQIDDDIPLGVVHISMHAGHELLRMLLDQDEITTKWGGTRIRLDGRDDSARSKTIRQALFWFGISLMVTGCCCSFLLSLRIQELLGIAPEQPQQPQRPERRRLTMEQVEEMLPVSDYETEPPYDEERGIVADRIECTICLDEFAVGDKMRTLPCGHTYHSDCITRWLTQRSSTCPLCKLDLFVEEEEEDDEEDEEESEEEEQEYVALGDTNAVTEVEDGNGSAVLHFFTGVGTESSNFFRRLRRRGQAFMERRHRGSDASRRPPLEGEMVMTQPLLSEEERDTETTEEANNVVPNLVDEQQADDSENGSPGSHVESETSSTPASNEMV